MRKRILVIEDSPEMRENTAEILGLHHYDVVTANDGKEGIEKINEIHPDLIICDVIMPDMDGFEVLKTISKTIRKDHIPFLFLTARAGAADSLTGLKLGATDYLTKPFKGEELLRIIRLKLEN
jgi:CRP/FNR family transcriptional regulator, polysaccharide utilization system transcription regulator